MQEQGSSINSFVDNTISVKERDLINIVFSQNPNDKILSSIQPVLTSDKVSWVLTITIRDKSYTLCSARSEFPRLFKSSNTCLRYIVEHFNRTNNVEITVETKHILALLGANDISLPVSLVANGLGVTNEGPNNEENSSTLLA